MKRLITLLTVVLLSLSLVPQANLSGTFTYQAEAMALNDLGLYKGVSQTNFDPDLGSQLNRETGIVMLMRLLGLDSSAKALTTTDVDAVLARYRDGSSVSSWARQSVAYAVMNGLVQGFPDGTLQPTQPLSGKQYCTMILRQLGYNVNFDSAISQLSAAAGPMLIQAPQFPDKELTRDALVGISYYAALPAKYAYGDGRTVLQNLVQLGAVDPTKASDQFGTGALIQDGPSEPDNGREPPEEEDWQSSFGS